MLTKNKWGLWLVGFALWLLLVPWQAQEMILGLIVTFIVAFALGDKVPFGFSLKWPLGLVRFVVLYIPLFLLELIKANIDVMLRVLNPTMPIKPGFVRVKRELKNEVATLTLANSITLTPGTITLDADEDYLYVHWIDLGDHDPMAAEAQVGSNFSAVLRKVFYE